MRAAHMSRQIGVKFYGPGLTFFLFGLGMLCLLPLPSKVLPYIAQITQVPNVNIFWDSSRLDPGTSLVPAMGRIFCVL